VRVFVGLKIATEIARELAQIAAGLEKLPVRLVPPADIHLTLVPPWSEASLPDAMEKLLLVAGRFDTFRLTIQHIGYGPQPKRPRLLWADCAATDDIAALRAALLLAYGQSDERPFRPHVTLARIRGNGQAVARKHPIDQDLSLTQLIDTVELFRSPPPGESGYRILASFRLGETRKTASSK
jgi:2'-5' RNA ligase